MSSAVKTNKISPATGTAFTLGDSGDTFTVPSGVTITNSGTATGFGGNNTPAFHAYRSSGSQSIAHDTKTKLEINAEWFDTDGAYDHTTNYRFTVPSGEGGKYFFFVGVHADCETNGALATFSAELYVNGSTKSLHDTGYNSGYIRKATHAFSTILTLSASDYVEVYFIGTKSSSTGTNFNIVGSNTYDQTWFGGYKMIGL